MVTKSNGMRRRALAQNLGPLNLTLTCDELPFVEIGDNVGHNLTSYRVQRIDGRTVYLRRRPLNQQLFSRALAQREPKS